MESRKQEVKDTTPQFSSINCHSFFGHINFHKAGVHTSQFLVTSSFHAMRHHFGKYVVGTESVLEIFSTSFYLFDIFRKLWRLVVRVKRHRVLHVVLTYSASLSGTGCDMVRGVSWHGGGGVAGGRGRGSLHTPASGHHEAAQRWDHGHSVYTSTAPHTPQLV